MRQTHQIVNPLAKLSPSADPRVDIQLDFPLYRKLVNSDNWRKDITLTRIDQDGKSVSLRYLRSTAYEQETVEFSKGHTAIDTGILDYTRGVGEYACSQEEFVALLTLGAKLLTEVTQELDGTLPTATIEPLYEAVANLRQSNGHRESERSHRSTLRATV